MTAQIETLFEQVEKLSCRFDPEPGHRHQVHDIACMIFDGIAAEFELDEHDKLLMRCGAMLHDTGWSQGQQKHHKTSMRIILEDTTVDFSQRQRNIVALIARYHRKALPKDKHDIYGSLDEDGKEKVRLLGGIVRLADGLDRSHMSTVKSVHCLFESDMLKLVCDCRGNGSVEQWAGRKKSDLLAAAAGCDIIVICR